MNSYKHLVEKTLVSLESFLKFPFLSEEIWVSCSEVDKPRACYAEWSKSEREKQVLTHIYRNYKNGTDEPICREDGDTDVENGFLDTAGGGDGGMSWESSVIVHYHVSNR